MREYCQSAIDVAAVQPLLCRPEVHVFGGLYRLFDVGGIVGIIGMAMMLMVAVVRHTIHLYRAERLP